MKYNVLTFRQEQLLKHKLSIEDAFLLMVIKDMYASERMESIIDNGKRYIWVNQEYLYSQIPVIGSISKLKRMLARLCDNGFLEKVLVTNKKGIAGRFYYVKITSMLDDLSDYDESQDEDTKCQNGTRSNVKMAFNQISKCHNKDSSVNDSSVKDSKTLSSDESDDVSEKYNYLSEMLESKMKFNNPKVKIGARDKWNNEFRLMVERDNRTEEEIIKVIDFSQNDNFWKANILSPSKLRAKFDTLFMQMGRDKSNGTYNQFTGKSQTKTDKRRGSQLYPEESLPDFLT